MILLIITLLTLVSCGEEKAQLASPVNVFKSKTVTLPETYQTVSPNIIDLGDRIGVVCHDGYNPEMNFDSVLYTIDKNGENPETKVLPKFRENANASGILPTSDGGYMMLDRCFEAEPYNIMYLLDKDMKLVKQIDLSKYTPDYFTGQMAAGSGGNFYLATQSEAMVFDKTGEILYRIPYSGWIDGITAMEDGRVTLSFTQSSNGARKLFYFDDASKSLGESVKAPTRLNASAITVYPGSDGYDMYLESTTGLYGYNIESGTETELCNWLNSDIVPNDIHSLHIISPDKFAMHCYGTIIGGGDTLTICVRVPEDEVTPKYLVTLQTVNTSIEMQRAVVSFNRQNDKYRVIVKDYSQYNTDEDAFASFSQLDRELVSGEYIPDILTVQSDTFEKYARLGLFYDLYKFMDKDQEINRETLLPCVQKPLETDGKLYRLAKSFRFTTMYTSKAFNVPRENWTLEKMLDLNDSADHPIIAGYFRAWLINYFFDYGMGEFIDSKNAKCSFDSETAVRLIEMIDSYGATWYAGGTGDARALERENNERLKAGQMLGTNTINSMKNLLDMSLSMDGEIPYIIGFPTKNGGTSYVDGIDTLAISSKSPVKEGAWQFIKYYISDSYASEDETLTDAVHRYGYSSIAEKCRKQLDYDETLVYYYDPSNENGIVNCTDEFNLQHLDTERYTVIEFPQEVREVFEDLINTSVNPRIRYNGVTDIIKEELDYLSAGVKTARETADIIRGRVSILVSEVS